MTHFVIRQGRSDCELCIRGHAPRRCIHWFVETPEGYTLSGPLDSSIEAEGLAHKRGYQPAPSYEPVSKQQRIDKAVAVELASFARYSANIERACEDGRISPHDRDERIARLEQGTANAIAYIAGEPRPKQRIRQPLDDPQAGVVG